MTSKVTLVQTQLNALGAVSGHTIDAAAFKDLLQQLTLLLIFAQSVLTIPNTSLQLIVVEVVHTLKYLSDVHDYKGSFEGAVAHRIKQGWIVSTRKEKSYVVNVCLVSCVGKSLTLV